MSDNQHSQKKFAHPFSTAGMGTVLFGLCQLLPKEHVATGLLICTIANPFLVSLLFLVYARYTVDPELIRYIAMLNRSMSQQKKMLKSGGLEPHIEQHIKSQLSQTQVKLASAYSDYANGTLKLDKITT